MKLPNSSHTTLKSLSQSVQLLVSLISDLCVTEDHFLALYLDAKKKKNTAKKEKSILSMCIQIFVCSDKKQTPMHTFARRHQSMRTCMHADAHTERSTHIQM